MEMKKDSAVSPVVGVMLMLVVTIIIAAVVSGFAGGLAGNNQKTPELTLDVHIKNNGYWTGSSFNARVTGVDKGIPTRDLKLITKWTHVYPNGTPVSGGATVLPNVNNTNLHYSPSSGCDNVADYNFVAPTGYGSGVGKTGETTGTGSGQSPTAEEKWFGNYNLVVGTSMWAEPFGACARPTAGGYVGYKIGYGTNGTRWGYKEGSDSCAIFNLPTDPKDLTSGQFDSMMAVLGANWYVLQPGDTVSVSIVHLPTGKTIWQKMVPVEA